MSYKLRKNTLLNTLRAGGLVTISIFFFIVQSPLVRAQSLSSADLFDIQNNSPNWVGGVGSGSSTCSTGSTTSTAVNVTITGNNVKDAFDFFIANGFSATQAAGIVGNLMYESDGTGGDINPTQNEIGGGGGYGIAQFTGAELTEMIQWTTFNGLDPNSLQGQLLYLLYDLGNSYQTVLAALNTSTSIADATQIFEMQYERPQGSNTTPPSGDAAASLSDRTEDAQAAYNDYSGDTPSTTVTVAIGSCSSGSATTTTDCSSATGNAKILCAAQPYAGVYYEYGGGHDGYAAYTAACPDPSNPPDNQPTGGLSIDGGESGNPSPCGLDCSALVSFAVDAAFNQDFDWTVDNYVMQGDGSQYWQPIPLASVQPGDIVTLDEHVEIVDHYDASTGTIYTFGAHETGTQTGEVSSALDFWNDAYTYTGPQS